MRLIRLTKQDRERIQQILKRYLDREEVQSMHRICAAWQKHRHMHTR